MLHITTLLVLLSKDLVCPSRGVGNSVASCIASVVGGVGSVVGSVVGGVGNIVGSVVASVVAGIVGSIVASIVACIGASVGASVVASVGASVGACWLCVGCDRCVCSNCGGRLSGWRAGGVGSWGGRGGGGWGGGLRAFRASGVGGCVGGVGSIHSCSGCSWRCCCSILSGCRAGGVHDDNSDVGGVGSEGVGSASTRQGGVCWWQQHAVNHVDGGVPGNDVGHDNACVVAVANEGDVWRAGGVVNVDSQVGTWQRSLDAGAGGEVAAVEGTGWDDVVGEDGGQLGLCGNRDNRDRQAAIRKAGRSRQTARR